MRECLQLAVQEYRLDHSQQMKLQALLVSEFNRISSEAMASVPANAQTYQPGRNDLPWNVPFQEVKKAEGQWRHQGELRVRATEQATKAGSIGRIESAALPGQLLAGAAVNSTEAFNNAIKGLGELFGGAGKLGSSRQEG